MLSPRNHEIKTAIRNFVYDRTTERLEEGEVHIICTVPTDGRQVFNNVTAEVIGPWSDDS